MPVWRWVKKRHRSLFAPPINQADTIWRADDGRQTGSPHTELFGKDGTPIPITKLNDDTAATISAIEVDADGRLTRIRLWDKNAALENPWHVLKTKRRLIVLGESLHSAPYSQGQRLLKHVEISGQLADVAQKVAEIAGLTAECTLKEAARISYFDPRRLFHSDRSLKQITEMDDDTRAAIASFEIDERKVDGVVVGRTTKIKLWDKIRALEMGMRHLGLYERHNTQQSENLESAGAAGRGADE